MKYLDVRTFLNKESYPGASSHLILNYGGLSWPLIFTHFADLKVANMVHAA